MKTEQISGDILLSNQSVACAYYKAPDCHYNASTAGFVPREKSKKARKWILGIGIPCVTIGAFLISMAAYYLLKKLDIQHDMFAGLFAAISATLTGIMTLIFSTVTKSKS